VAFHGDQLCLNGRPLRDRWADAQRRHQERLHSTDTHGYSEVIFASTYLLGFEFAPRIKGVGRQQLYAFKHRKHYEEQGYLLLPDHYIRENQFEDQWDDVLRFIATIRLKVTTASQLFQALEFLL